MRTKKFKNILKFFVALVIGGVLGEKLLAPGEPLTLLLFLVSCYAGGFILHDIGK